MIQIDMPMPKVCDDCPFMDEDHGDYPYCVALEQNRGYSFDVFTKRFSNCPLMPVEEHKEMATIFSTGSKIKRQIPVSAIRCLVCGKLECSEFNHELYDVVITGETSGICESCRKAIEWAKERMEG